MSRVIIIYAVLTALTVAMGLEVNAYENNHDCEKHPIYCQIISNRPTIKRAYAFELSNIISKKTRKYSVDPAIFTAILAQESMYKLSAKNCTKGLTKIETAVNYPLVGQQYVVKEVCADFGIAMINYITANRSDVDISRLLNDLEYSIEVGTSILAKFKSGYAHKERYWYVRYNCGTKKNINRATCIAYKSKINKYLPKWHDDYDYSL